MKVGDLVKIAENYKEDGRLALVVEIPAHLGCAKILYYDIGKIVPTLKSRLEVVSESR